MEHVPLVPGELFSVTSRMLEIWSPAKSLEITGFYTKAAVDALVRVPYVFFQDFLIRLLIFLEIDVDAIVRAHHLAEPTDCALALQGLGIRVQYQRPPASLRQLLHLVGILLRYRFCEKYLDGDSHAIKHTPQVNSEVAEVATHCLERINQRTPPPRQ